MLEAPLRADKWWKQEGPVHRSEGRLGSFPPYHRHRVAWMGHRPCGVGEAWVSSYVNRNNGRRGKGGMREGDNRGPRNKGVSSEETVEQCGNIRGRKEMDGAEGAVSARHSGTCL